MIERYLNKIYCHHIFLFFPLARNFVAGMTISSRPVVERFKEDSKSFFNISMCGESMSSVFFVYGIDFGSAKMSSMVLTANA